MHSSFSLTYIRRLVSHAFDTKTHTSKTSQLLPLTKFTLDFLILHTITNSFTSLHNFSSVSATSAVSSTNTSCGMSCPSVESLLKLCWSLLVCIHWLWTIINSYLTFPLNYCYFILFFWVVFGTWPACNVSIHSVNANSVNDGTGAISAPSKIYTC